MNIKPLEWTPTTRGFWISDTCLGKFAIHNTPPGWWKAHDVTRGAGFKHVRSRAEAEAQIKNHMARQLAAMIAELTEPEETQNILL